MNLILLLVVAFILLGLVEHLRHERSLRRIPLRIHVNGTRGKSSVTRLIAAGLRAGGVRTVAKTTGSEAKYIHPDGSEEPVERHGPANIKEQIAVMRRAAAEGAEALVIECMAVRPDLQAVSEKRIVKSTIGVLTNVRPDHLEVMGPGLVNVAQSLSNTIPERGRLFLGESNFKRLFARAARDRNTEVRLADRSDLAPIDLEGFRYIEHPENVGLALEVCEAAGVPRAVALTGMRSVTPDIGALTRIRLEHGGKVIEFINAFAANDPDSTLMVWERLGFTTRAAETLVILLNLRGDRMRRSKDLAPLVHRTLRAGAYLLIGDHTRLFRRIAVRHGTPPDLLVDLGGASAEEIYQTVFQIARSGTTVVGIGNIGGAGRSFLEYLDSGRGRT